MNIHKNARLTPRGREFVVRQIETGQTPKAVGEAAGVCPRTVLKWVARYRAAGLVGLRDRSSRPRKLHRPTPVAITDQAVALRRQRLPGKEIALRLNLSPATVSRILKRAGLNRMKDIDPPQPIHRYERQRPGEMIHIDIKKLNRFHESGHRITGNRGAGRSVGAGWEFAHVCIDDNSRVAFTQMKKDEKALSAVAFLKAAVAYYQSLGVKVERVMTDNGSCYRSFAFAAVCKRLKLRHIRTKPYTPKTNGKAERFIQTALREWAYAQAYDTSDQRAAQLPYWLHRYNWHRPHGGIGDKTPISRLGLTGNNLLRLHS